MRRFASHRVCFLHTGEILKKQVVEIDEISGVVLSVYPFVEEISFTEWLGGIILLSDVAPERCGSESFETFTGRFVQKHHTEDGNMKDNLCLKAYFITEFNLQQMEFMPQSRIISLK